MCMHAYQALKFVPKIVVSAFALALLPVTLFGLSSVYGSLFRCVGLVVGGRCRMLCTSVATVLWAYACKQNVGEVWVLVRARD